MVNIRKTYISGGIFTGYETSVDLDYIDSLQDIVNVVISNLKKALKFIKLQELSNSIDLRVYHIHSTSLEEILISEPDFIIYICNHC
jgi:hypothetical protein